MGFPLIRWCSYFFHSSFLSIVKYLMAAATFLWQKRSIESGNERICTRVGCLPRYLADLRLAEISFLRLNLP